MRWVLLILSWPFWIRFKWATKNLLKEQENLRLRLFSEAMTILHYKEKSFGASQFEDLPISDYDDIVDFVSKGKALSRKPVFQEATSGSTGAKKIIPHSARSFFHFSCLFMIWMHDILRHYHFKKHTIFLSISPNVDHKKEDDEYLPWFLRLFLKNRLCIPKGLKKIKDSESFRSALADYFIENGSEIEIISIWSPSYLLVIIDEIKKKRHDLQVNHVFLGLKFISCWGDGASKSDYQRLKETFPQIPIQKKGLLSTEFAMSLPLIGKNGHLPLPHFIYYEFEKDSRLYKMCEIEKGMVYSLVLSQSGGFIRYRTHDQVKILTEAPQTVEFEFVCRVNKFSDMVGEKLNASFVAEILSELYPKDFTFLLAHNGNEKHYFLIASQDTPDDQLTNVELKLMENPHYAWARKLGQLGSLKFKTFPNPRQTYLDIQQERGIKLGDIKFQALI